MQLALIGAGKTGSEVIPLIKKNLGDHLIGPFTSKDSIQLYKKELLKADIILIFTPSTAFETLLPYLLDLPANIPLLIGTTGLRWDKEILDRLEREERVWIQASNFSLGMGVIKSLLTTVTKHVHLLPHANYHIEETHHIHKKDAPSGTALSWQRWLSPSLPQIKMTSYREGDVVGNHRLTIQTDTEEIIIEHRAKTRAIFAEGALWSARELVKSVPQKKGLILFEDWIADKRGEN